MAKRASRPQKFKLCYVEKAVGGLIDELTRKKNIPDRNQGLMRRILDEVSVAGELRREIEHLH